MQNKMKKSFSTLSAFFLISYIITGCASVRYITPQVVKNELTLNNLPANKTKVIVTDYRLSTYTDDVCTSIQKQLIQALSQDAALSDVTYILTVDVIEYKSFFTHNEWHGEMKLKVILKNANDKLLGSWDIYETTKLANLWGYATAKQVSQEVYEKAMSYLISVLNNEVKLDVY